MEHTQNTQSTATPRSCRNGKGYCEHCDVEYVKDNYSCSRHEQSDRHREKVGLPKLKRRFGCKHPGCDKQFSRRENCTIHEKRCRKGPGSPKDKRLMPEQSDKHREKVGLPKSDRSFGCKYPGCDKQFSLRKLCTRHEKDCGERFDWRERDTPLPSSIPSDQVSPHPGHATSALLPSLPMAESNDWREWDTPLPFSIPPNQMPPHPGHATSALPPSLPMAERYNDSGDWDLYGTSSIPPNQVPSDPGHATPTSPANFPMFDRYDDWGNWDPYGTSSILSNQVPSDLGHATSTSLADFLMRMSEIIDWGELEQSAPSYIPSNQVPPDPGYATPTSSANFLMSESIDWGELDQYAPPFSSPGHDSSVDQTRSTPDAGGSQFQDYGKEAR